jgi:selenocysteine lyase/cysteine desulfurase
MATPVERLVERFTDHTRVVAISWVQYQSGAVTDLARLAAACRARGIWTVVDGFQGLGLYPCELDRWGIDVLCTGSHKWLAGPVGVGILAVRRDRLPALRPLVIGAHTYGTCDDPTSAACTLRRDADRFESGSRQVLDILALEASAQLFLETGIGNVLGEVRRLAGILREGLLALGFPVVSPGDPPYGGIVTFSPTGRGRTVAWAAQRLREARITFAPRGPGIRLSPHAHNTDDDIARALACLR